MALMSGLHWYMKNDSIFPLFILFFISIPNVNWFFDHIHPAVRNVIATNNDLLMEELNVIYFAPKLWLYLMIWLAQTTNN